MRKFLSTTCLVSIFLLVSSFTSTTQIDKTSAINVITNDNVIVSDFHQGWEHGYCEGWKDVKGEFALYPLAPLGKDSYRGRYNMGFKAGMKAAQR